MSEHESGCAVEHGYGRCNCRAARPKPHLWRMVSQSGRACEWECHCGCGAHKTTYDGNA